MKGGELEIQGTIDNRDIVSGLDRIGDALENTKAKGNNVNSSMSLLSSTASSVAKQFMIFATVGVGAMTALASKSPAVAPELAKMSVELTSISNQLGEHLKPAFAAIADELLPAMGEAIDNNSAKITTFVGLITEGIHDLSSLATGEFQNIEQLGEKTALSIAGAIAGAFITKSAKGAVAGAAAGYALEKAIVPDDVPAYYRRNLGTFAETFTAMRDVKSGGTDAFSLIGGGARIVTNLILDSLQAMGIISDKQASLSSAEMVVG